MPIYEFYCPECHRLFNFLSNRVDTRARPDCPRCGREQMTRRPARFAALSGSAASSDDPDMDMGPLDETRIESALEELSGEMEQMVDDEDPRAAARLFRRFGKAAGVEPSGELEEYLARLEAGEDPDLVEEEMGDAFDDDEALEGLFRAASSRAGRLSRPPIQDEELYYLD